MSKEFIPEVMGAVKLLAQGQEAQFVAWMKQPSETPNDLAQIPYAIEVLPEDERERAAATFLGIRLALLFPDLSRMNSSVQAFSMLQGEVLSKHLTLSPESRTQ